MALEKNIDLGFEGLPTPLTVQGDANSLMEMLNNLIDNAIRYTPAGGHITVAVQTTSLGAVLSVEDNGPGIEPQHRERVFERFYRILGSGQSGSGLGLSIVAEVAKRHGAELILDSGSNGIGHPDQRAFSAALKGSAYQICFSPSPSGTRHVPSFLIEVSIVGDNMLSALLRRSGAGRNPAQKRENPT